DEERRTTSPGVVLCLRCGLLAHFPRNLNRICAGYGNREARAMRQLQGTPSDKGLANGRVTLIIRQPYEWISNACHMDRNRWPPERRRPAPLPRAPWDRAQ